MYDTLIAAHVLELIQESLEKITFRFSDISCPDDFLLSESGMMILDSICMKLTAIGESIKNLDKVTNKELYRICQKDIPQLQQVITRMLNDLRMNIR